MKHQSAFTGFVHGTRRGYSIARTTRQESGGCVECLTAQISTSKLHFSPISIRSFVYVYVCVCVCVSLVHSNFMPILYGIPLSGIQEWWARLAMVVTQWPDVVIHSPFQILGSIHKGDIFFGVPSRPLKKPDTFISFGPFERIDPICLNFRTLYGGNRLQTHTHTHNQKKMNEKATFIDVPNRKEKKFLWFK